MGRIVVTEFVSVDGVMEAPGPDGSGFKHEGWTFNISTGEEGNKFKLDETMAAEAQLLGRVTYQAFASAWPSVKDEFGDKFNSMPKYVVSSTLEKAEWNNSTVLKGDVLKEVSKLKQRLEGDIVVHGSAQLVQTLLANDLVDELRLMVYPVVLGSGKRLFGDSSDLKRLRLKDSRTVGDGVLILTYEPAGKEATKAPA
jgi:dihydrofolate reductase